MSQIEPKNSYEVRCKFCKEVISLVPDSEDGRMAGSDPHQQLRKHLLSRHLRDLTGLAYRMAWLIDMLAFEAVADPARWRASIDRMVDYCQSGAVWQK